MRDETAQHEIVSRILAEYGRIDGVVTAAGVAGGGPVHALDIENWQLVQDINLTGTMLTAKAVLPTMMEQRSGSIVTVASIEGIEGCEGGSTYNASKGGVILLTKNLANDYGRLGIRANAICPGFIQTPMFEATVPLYGRTLPTGYENNINSDGGEKQPKSPAPPTSLLAKIHPSSQESPSQSMGDTPQATGME